jgi:hypothetical protein
LRNFIARALRHFSQIREKSLAWIAKLAWLATCHRLGNDNFDAAALPFGAVSA